MKIKPKYKPGDKVLFVNDSGKHTLPATIAQIATEDRYVVKWWNGNSNWHRIDIFDSLSSKVVNLEDMWQEVLNEIQI